MGRNEFRKYFKTSGPAILPVIHALDIDQVTRNIEIAMQSGAQGVFLINHDFERDKLLPIIRTTRQRFPGLWLGVNFLAVTGRDAFPILGDLQNEGVPVDAYWADDARIDERSNQQIEALEMDEIRKQSHWQGLYFGGTAFKKQREVDPASFQQSASLACKHMDVVTTSGVATGKAADIEKITTFRRACGDHPLAVASGITPDNISDYAPLLDAILIATGINEDGDFYNINAQRLQTVLERSRHLSTHT